jgi:decaprenylphospho-beta-D-ribofuranose 2-oxidase
VNQSQEIAASTDVLLSGWGRTAPTHAQVLRPSATKSLQEALEQNRGRTMISRGMGRSYGDPAQNAGGIVVDTTALDQMWLDSSTGALTAQSGVTVDTILARSVPHGWFIPVTPGTRFVSVGGALAADIHGKNHHKDGSFSQHVAELRLLTSDGHLRDLGPGHDSDELFWATIGGMGRTGIITQATVRMIPIETSRIRVDTDRFTSLDALMARMVESDSHYRYTVAWIDSVAGSSDFRSVLTCGDHAQVAELSKSQVNNPLDYDPKVVIKAPRWFPRHLLNRWTVSAFNELWFRKAPQHRQGELQTIAEFFHPLDLVDGWNRIYGSTGFVQYQFVVPDSASDVVRQALTKLRSAGAISFLSVLKRFGPQNPAPLSFPTAGWTLALDIPADVPGLASVLDQLDQLVVEAGGRLYLAKDARMSPETFRASYPRLDEWLKTVNSIDPDETFRSDLFRRLLP